MVVRVLTECSLFLSPFKQQYNLESQRERPSARQFQDEEKSSFYQEKSRVWRVEALKKTLFRACTSQQQQFCDGQQLQHSLFPMCNSDVIMSVVYNKADRETDAGGQTVRGSGKQKDRDSVMVNNELGELFISPLLPVFKEVSHQMDCRLIDF